MPTTITTTAVQDVLNDLAENERALATPENDKGRAGTRPSLLLGRRVTGALALIATPRSRGSERRRSRRA